MSDESEWADSNDEKCGEEMEWGEGDPRVLFVVNPVLSTVFTAVVVYGFLYIDLAAFSVVSVTLAALVFTVVMCLVMN